MQSFKDICKNSQNWYSHGVKDVPVDNVLITAGVFYFQLGNLSPKFRSSLSSIHLVSIAKSSVIQKYGPDKILEPFMDDITKLEKVNI